MCLLFPSVRGNFESRCPRYYLSNKTQIWLSFLMLCGSHLIAELLWGKWVLWHLKLRDALIYLLTGITALWEPLLCGKSRWNWESQNPWGNLWQMGCSHIWSGKWSGCVCRRLLQLQRQQDKARNKGVLLNQIYRIPESWCMCTKVTFSIRMFGL